MIWQGKEVHCRERKNPKPLKGYIYINTTSRANPAVGVWTGSHLYMAGSWDFCQEPNLFILEKETLPSLGPSQRNCQNEKCYSDSKR